MCWLQVRRRYLIQRLPDYLLLHLVRFKRNNFYIEKNPTIVNFPVKNLEMRDYVFNQGTNIPSVEQLEGMSIGEIKRFLSQYSIDTNGVLEKRELVELAQDFVLNTLPDLLSTKYDLVANICHDSPPGEGGQGALNANIAGSYRVHVQNKVCLTLFAFFFMCCDILIYDDARRLNNGTRSKICTSLRQCPK